MIINYGFDFHKISENDIIQILEGLEAVDLIDSSGNTPLLWACKSLKPHVVKYLLSKNVNVNFINTGGEAPLHEVINSAGHNEEAALDIISMLLKAGADLELRAYMEKTPFLKACSRNSLSVLSLLVTSGCDTKAVVFEDGKVLDGSFYSEIFSTRCDVKEFIKKAVIT